MDIKKFNEKYLKLLTGDKDLGYLHHLHAMEEYGKPFPKEEYENLVNITKEFDNHLYDDHPQINDDYIETLVFRDTFIFETLYAICKMEDDDLYADFFERIIQE